MLRGPVAWAEGDLSVVADLPVAHFRSADGGGAGRGDELLGVGAVGVDLEAGRVGAIEALIGRDEVCSGNLVGRDDRAAEDRDADVDGAVGRIQIREDER